MKKAPKIDLKTLAMASVKFITGQPLEQLEDLPPRKHRRLRSNPVLKARVEREGTSANALSYPDPLSLVVNIGTGQGLSEAQRIAQLVQTAVSALTHKDERTDEEILSDIINLDFDDDEPMIIGSSQIREFAKMSEDYSDDQIDGISRFLDQISSISKNLDSMDEGDGGDGGDGDGGDEKE